MSYQLPENFFFGGAMSGPQTEGKWQDGGKLPNLWDTWSNLDIHAFHNRVGSYAGNDFTERMEDDLQLLKSLGLDSIRTSIQWSRLLDINGNLNPEGEKYYHHLFAVAKKVGIEIFVNLYHFDMPEYLFNRGGQRSATHLVAGTPLLRIIRVLVQSSTTFHLLTHLVFASIVVQKQQVLCLRTLALASSTALHHHIPKRIHLRQTLRRYA